MIYLISSRAKLFTLEEVRNQVNETKCTHIIVEILYKFNRAFGCISDIVIATIKLDIFPKFWCDRGNGTSCGNILSGPSGIMAKNREDNVRSLTLLKIIPFYIAIVFRQQLGILLLSDRVAILSRPLSVQKFIPGNILLHKQTPQSGSSRTSRCLSSHDTIHNSLFNLFN